MLQEGDKVGRFIVEKVLGEGGMGVVYQAHDENLGRKVALKVVATTGDSESSARVLREARVIAALDHPNAVTIFEGGEVNGEPYIAMELVPGENLRGSVSNAEIEVTTKVRWLVEVARALAAAHRKSIVHRDIKPENVMVRPDGRIKVLDFGIARLAASPINAAGPTVKAFIPTVTSAGGFVGTPMYTAPELLKGKSADGRSDQFSWAVMAYELLEGKPPWDAPDALGIVAAMMSEAPKPMVRPDVPKDVREVIMRALSTSPAARFGSMDDIIELLEPFARDSAQQETTIPSPIVSVKPIAPAKPKGSITGGKYSTAELGQVIALALERKAEADAAGGKYGYDELKSAANEVGIAESELRAALASLRPALPPMTDKPSARRLRSRQRLERHAAIWGVCSLFFFLIDLVSHGPFFFFFPVLSWGVALGIHAATYFFPVSLTPEEEEYHERQRQIQKEKLLRKLKAKDARVQGAKLRIAPPVEAASEAENEALAEEELEQQLREASKKRAR